MAQLDRELTALAEGNEARHALLIGRRDRSKLRGRWVTCQGCGTRTHDTRDAGDICKRCLLTLWQAYDAHDRKNEAEVGEGLQVYRMTETSHWLPAPQLMLSYDEPPFDAVFARQGSFGKLAGGSATLQHLYVEMMEALATVLPVDPGLHNQAITFLHASYDSTLYARLPPAFIKAFGDLWHLVAYISAESHAQGFRKGHDLLARMNDGSATFEQFTDAVTQQGRNDEGRIRDAADGKLRK